MSKQIKEWEFMGLEDLPRAYKVFGGNSPMIVVAAPGAEEALCYSRRFDVGYCCVQRLTQNEIDFYPPVTPKTKFFDCFVLCSLCKDISLHFSKSSCVFKIPDVCESEE